MNFPVINFSATNTFLIALVLAAVIVGVRKVLAAIAEHHGSMNKNQTDIIEQVMLAKFNALTAATISQKTDDKVAADAAKIDTVSQKIDAQNLHSVVVAGELARTVTATAGELAQKVAATAGQLAGTVSMTVSELAARVESVHKLVNGPMTARVRQVAEQARRIAELTRRPEDAENADAAELDLAANVAKDIAAGESHNLEKTK